MRPPRVPDLTLHTRVRNDALGGPDPHEWKEIPSKDVFAGKRVIVVGLPGAFTPSCSDTHLPEFEKLHDDFSRLGVDQIVCLSVNDAFVMFQWANSRSIEKVFMLPDGNAEFTRHIGMLVDDKAMLKVFAEPDIRDRPEGVGVSVSNAGTMLDFLQSSEGRPPRGIKESGKAALPSEIDARRRLPSAANPPLVPRRDGPLPCGLVPGLRSLAPVHPVP